MSKVTTTNEASLKKAGGNSMNIQKSILQALRQFIREEEGVTAIEYALIAALIAIVIIGGATAVGLNINNLFLTIATALTNA